MSLRGKNIILYVNYNVYLILKKKTKQKYVVRWDYLVDRFISSTFSATAANINMYSYKSYT